MLNQPKTQFDEADVASSPGGQSWQIDQNPTFRLFWLSILVAIPLVTVAGRLVYLQCFIADSFTTISEHTITTYEPIFSPNGRILTSDRRVLAEDVEQFHLQMHYRWLEEPSNRSWLLKQVLSRLSLKERRDASRVEAEKRRFLWERKDSWKELAELFGMTDEDFQRQRQRVQARVERILANVEQRRADRRIAASNPKVSQSNGESSAIGRAWKTIVAALTTPPDRTFNDPVVVKEELEYHTIVTDVPLEAVVNAVSRPNLFPLVRYIESTRRTYPSGSIAPHVVGTRVRMSDLELAHRGERFPNGDPLGYVRGDDVGKTGVERSYDRYIRGIQGQRRIVKNGQGEIIRTEIVRSPAKGRDVTLTVNFELQSLAESLLDTVVDLAPNEATSKENAQPERTGGTIVVLDVHNGEVLAAASAPRFDLNLFVNSDREEWDRANSDPRRPFFPRVTAMTIPPGSVFKTLTAVAMLQSGLDPQHEIHCRGYLDSPDQYRCYTYQHWGIGHGDMPLGDAICRSCNVYFFSTARSLFRKSRRNGEPERISHWARKFGFGQRTGIDLPGERNGNLPKPDPSHKRQTVMLSETMGLAIGQARLTVTPLQIVRMMAAVANGGFLVTPHVVRDIEPANHLEESVPRVAMENSYRSHQRINTHNRRRIEGLHPRVLKQVREGLRKVVAHPKGTGYKRVRLDQVTIAGKTGTAEVGGGRKDHAWFAGYVPADAPKYAFVVVLEHAGLGGREAGPVAKQLVESMLSIGIVRRKADSLKAPLAN